MEEQGANLSDCVGREEERGHIGERDHCQGVEAEEDPDTIVPHAKCPTEQQDDGDRHERFDYVGQKIRSPVAKETHA